MLEVSRVLLLEIERCFGMGPSDPALLYGAEVDTPSGSCTSRSRERDGGDTHAVRTARVLGQSLVIAPRVDDERSAGLEMSRVPGHELQAIADGRSSDEKIGGKDWLPTKACAG